MNPFVAILVALLGVIGMVVAIVGGFLLMGLMAANAQPGDHADTRQAWLWSAAGALLLVLAALLRWRLG